MCILCILARSALLATAALVGFAVACNRPPAHQLRAPTAPPATTAAPSTTAVPTTVEPAASEPSSPDASSEVPPKDFKRIPKRRPGGFPGIKFAYVEAFAIRQRDPDELFSPLNENGALNRQVVRPGVRLDTPQTKRLLAIIRNPATYAKHRPICFEPRHTFIFFDAAGAPVATYSICFACNNFDADPGVPGTKDEHAFADVAFDTFIDFCEELGLKYCPADQERRTRIGTR